MVFLVFRSYAGLGLAVGEAAHIAISDGSVFGLNAYSTLPGSKIKKREADICSIVFSIA